MNDQPGKQQPSWSIPTASAILDDGTMVELVYQEQQKQTLLALYNAGRWTLQPEIKGSSNSTLIPFSPRNNLIANEAVLLPSEPRIYGDEETILSDVTNFIHRYVDFSPRFETIASHYVVLSWLHDAFNELPYLRLRGDFGSGKTRGLIVIGSLCYKPFFASGASTVSPIFHTLNAFRGTLILDEADFRFSDEKAEIVKILNNGNVRGIPILRTMINRQREFNPEAFHVFGPKVVATRGGYDDKGLESRFLTEDMVPRRPRADIPINLPERFREEALELRNKLLLYRFHRRFETRIDESLIDPELEPRSNQILLPLLSVVRDPNLHDELRSAAREAHAGLVAERGLLQEAHLLEALAQLIGAAKGVGVSVGDIAHELNDRYGTEYQRPITSRWVGALLRRRLNIRSHKSHGLYVVPITEFPKIRALCLRYGVVVTKTSGWPLGHGDVGTS